jgi:hypothetical protein
MNQDQVKDVLYSLYPEHGGATFTVTFTGKKSRKVNGLYKPATREILIHNKNFTADYAMLYTAIHELAHHVLCTTFQMGARAHSSLFWSTFHDLLGKAEKSGVYKTPEMSQELTVLLGDIKDMMSQIVKLQEEAGRLLTQAQVRCQEEGIRYEDVIDRKLGMQKSTAQLYQKMKNAMIPAELGPDAAKLCVTAKKGEAVQEALSNGSSLDQARQHVVKGVSPVVLPPNFPTLRIFLLREILLTAEEAIHGVIDA